jgi:hypothetical protein
MEVKLEKKTKSMESWTFASPFFLYELVLFPTLCVLDYKGFKLHGTLDIFFSLYQTIQHCY